MTYNNNLHSVSHKTFQEAFLYQLNKLMSFPEIDVRGSTTREMLHASFTILDSQSRHLLLKHRRNNVFAQIAETLWVLSGNNDLEYITHYLPRAPLFSDDDKTWRAGYGPRIRNWQTIDLNDANDATKWRYTSRQTDQLQQVVTKLNQSHNTRQAVISIWDPSEDWVDSKDIPCNNWLHFLIRDNKLHLNVAVRSNDIVWGFSGINFFEWSVLLQIVASCVGASPGQITWTASSLHMYERHYKRANLMCKDGKNIVFFQLTNPGKQLNTHLSTAYDDLYSYDQYIQEIMSYDMSMWRRGITETSPPEHGDQLLDTFSKMLHLYNYYINASGDFTTTLADLLQGLPECDIRLAAYEYFHRHHSKEVQALLTDEERDHFHVARLLV